MLKNPLGTLIPPWSWKAAVLTAVLRSSAFFAINLQSGRREAIKAMLAEAVFAVFAGGLIGAISQYLRKAEPLWATALLVWVGLPSLMLFAQVLVHRIARTPRLTGSLMASFGLGALASAFTWYAMRRGALLGGVDETSLSQDVKSLPGITLDFVLAGPRLVAAMLGRGPQPH